MCAFRRGVGKDSKRALWWCLSLKISPVRKHKLSCIGKPRNITSYLTSERIIRSSRKVWAESSFMQGKFWWDSGEIKGMRAQTQPQAQGFSRWEKLHPEHPWGARGYWVSKKGHPIRREKGPEIRMGKELKTRFAYFTILLFDLRSTRLSNTTQFFKLFLQEMSLNQL